MIIATPVEQAVDAAEAAATKLEEEEDVAGMTERIATADAITAVTPRSTAGTTAPFASRTNRLMKPNMLMLHTLVSQRHLPLTLGARPPRTPIQRAFSLSLATEQNGPRVKIKCVKIEGTHSCRKISHSRR